MGPRYVNICFLCEYLGQYKNYDLYYCAGEPTVVCRYSDEGSDYSSGLDFALTEELPDYGKGELTHYQVALIRALRKSDKIKTEIYDYFSKNYEQDNPDMFKRFLRLLRMSFSSKEI